MVEDFDKNLKKNVEEEKKTGDAPEINANLNFDRIGKTQNDIGKQARIGQSGKYYCGGILGTKCNCCDGQCGTTSGCNCLSCMKLDIKARMLPKGYLVNKEGRCVRKGLTGLFYCGAKVMNGSLNCDGWCGPSNGP